jgi:hypothetical protein
MRGLGSGERGQGVGVGVSVSVGRPRVGAEEGELAAADDDIPRRREQVLDWLLISILLAGERHFHHFPYGDRVPPGPHMTRLASTAFLHNLCPFMKPFTNL